MEIQVNQYGNIQLQKVFNPVVFKTQKGETLTVVMRDSGFELNYTENDLSTTTELEIKYGVVKVMTRA